MEKYFASLQRVPVEVKCDKRIGDFKNKGFALSHGGLGKYPLPPAVVRGVEALKPERIRIFIQEFFNIYPGHDTFNWDDLDAFMDYLRKRGQRLLRQ